MSQTWEHAMLCQFKFCCLEFSPMAPSTSKGLRNAD